MKPKIATTALLLWQLGCATESATDPAPNGGSGGSDEIEAACSSLCSNSGVRNCHEDESSCRALCQQRFGANLACRHQGAEVIRCHQQTIAADCTVSAQCAQSVADYAACSGISACITANNCQSSPPGCECTMACAGFSLVARCDPQTGHCNCAMTGPLGYSIQPQDELNAECNAVGTTNKWCISQPLGCCAEWF